MGYFHVRHDPTDEYVVFDMLGNVCRMDEWHGTRFDTREAANHMARTVRDCVVEEVLEEQHVVIGRVRGVRKIKSHRTL